MDINGLLKEFTCECGKVHSCDIKYVFVEAGAIKRLPEICNDFNNILIVADKNTYGVCGNAVVNQIKDKVYNTKVFECDGFLVPDEESVEAVESELKKDTDLIIGIGSGVIQDLCKYVSFNANLPYYIVATAPSMDGYASKGAAMIMQNMKITYNAHVPKAIIGDVDILKDAPMDMIKSGYGDILGKFSCLNDWKLSHVVNDEYICDYVYNLTFDMLSKTKDLGPLLLKRDKDAIKTLMEALVGVGIAMAYVGNSRPASGSEHHLSHYFEIVGLLNDEPYFMHGTDVVYSSVYTQKLREKLLGLNAPEKAEAFDKSDWKMRIEEIYTKAADGVISLQEKLGWYEIDRCTIYKEKWEEIKKVLGEAPSVNEMKRYLKSIDLDIEEFEKSYGEEKIENALLFAKDLKDRYSVLWMYFDLFYTKTK